MINYHKNLVSALNTVLPTHYEMTLTNKTKTPCISYMELNNIADISGDTLGYSTIIYQVKIWGTDLKVLQENAVKVDSVLRPLGFTRTGATELYDRNSTMIQKILTFEALASETY